MRSTVSYYDRYNVPHDLYRLQILLFYKDNYDNGNLNFLFIYLFFHLFTYLFIFIYLRIYLFFF